MTPEPQLLRVPDFLNRYAVSRSDFYRRVERGEIPILKLGRSTRVRVADAEAWAASLPERQG